MKKGLLALLITLLVCAGFAPVFLTYIQPDSAGTVDLTITDGDQKGWSVYIAGGDAVTPLEPTGGLYEVPEGTAVYYRSRVLAEDLADALLELRPSNSSVSVFLDGELIYTDDPGTGGRIGDLSLSMKTEQRDAPVLITLPQDYLGKTLTVAQPVSPGEKPGYDQQVFPCETVLYSAKAYESLAISQTTQTAYMAMLYMAVAVVLLALFIFQAVHGEWSFGLVFLALFLLFWMAEILLTAPFSYHYFGAPPFDASGTLVQLSVSALLVFLGLRFSRPFRLAMLIVVGVQLALLLLSVLTQMGLLVPYGDFYLVLIDLPEWGHLLALLAGLVFAVLEWRRGSSFFGPFCKTAAVLLGAYLLFTLFSPLYWPGYIQSVAERLAGVFQLVTPRYPVTVLRWVLVVPSIAAALTEFMVKEVRKRADLSALALKSQLAYDNLRRMQQSAGTLREWRHNMLHHLSVLEHLQQEGEQQRLAEYLKGLTADIHAVAPLQYAAHPVVNAVLSSCLGEAQEEGIRVEAEAAVPEKIGVADSDLCNLLVNMLDNAREACEQMPPDALRRIRVRIHMRGRYLYVGVENTKATPVYYDQQRNICLTTKADRENHNYGMRTMESIARRYDSRLCIEYTEDSFSISTALLQRSVKDRPAGDAAL